MLEETRKGQEKNYQIGSNSDPQLHHSICTNYRIYM